MRVVITGRFHCAHFEGSTCIRRSTLLTRWEQDADARDRTSRCDPLHCSGNGGRCSWTFHNAVFTTEVGRTLRMDSTFYLPTPMQTMKCCTLCSSTPNELGIYRHQTRYRCSKCQTPLSLAVHFGFRKTVGLYGIYSVFCNRGSKLYHSRQCNASPTDKHSEQRAHHRSKTINQT